MKTDEQKKCCGLLATADYSLLQLSIFMYMDSGCMLNSD